jgi:hypothetical protein
LAIRAAATRNGLKDLDLFAVFTDDQVPDVDDAIETGVGALESGVVRLYGVVVILSGWVCWARGRLLCGHEVPLRGPCLGVCHHRRGFLRCQQYCPISCIDLQEFSA